MPVALSLALTNGVQVTYIVLSLVWIVGTFTILNIVLNVVAEGRAW